MPAAYNLAGGALHARRAPGLDRRFATRRTARASHPALPGLVKAGQRVHARREGEPAADRHPGEGDGDLHLRAQRPGPGHAPRPRRPAARPGRRRTTASNPTGRSRSTRARSRTSRASQVVQIGNFVGVVAPTGVRRDPGRGPAEGHVGADAEALRHREHLEADARLRRGGPGSGPLRRRTWVTSTRRSPAAAKTVSATLHVRVQRPLADRPALRRRVMSRSNGARVYSNAQNTYYAAPDVGGERPGLRRSNQVRVELLRGLERLRQLAARPIRPSAAALLSQVVGAPVRAAVHALGRARLGQLRPAALMRHPRRRRRDRQHRRDRADTQFGIPSDSIDPPELMVGLTQKSTGSRSRRTASIDTTNSGTQYNLKNRRVIGKSAAAAEQLLQDALAAGAERPADVLRLRAVRRRARAMRRTWIRTSSGSRTSPRRPPTRRTASRAHVGPLEERPRPRSPRSSNWQPKVANSSSRPGDVVKGRGIALGTFANTMIGNVADITVNMKTRQDHADAVLLRAGHRADRLPGRRREPGRSAASSRA